MQHTIPARETGQKAPQTGRMTVTVQVIVSCDELQAAPIAHQLERKSDVLARELEVVYPGTACAVTVTR